MAALSAMTTAPSRSRQAFAWSLCRAVLRAYAHLLFSRSLAVGAVLIAATAIVPRALLGGLAGALLALGMARLCDFDREAILDGSYGVSALLLGLGVAQWFGLGQTGIVLLCVFAPLSVLFSAALRSAMAAAQLPILSMPFLGAFFLLLALAGSAALPFAHTAIELPSYLSTYLPESVRVLLSSVGALFFLPRPDCGALILLALALHSRIATLLATLALVLCLFARPLLPVLIDEGLFHSLVYNSVFAAVALGGVWFVPSFSSFVLAASGVLLCLLITVGALGPLAKLGLPVLIIPFNLTMVIALLALRQRTHDRRPKSVDFAGGTPEQNLAYFRTRLARFQSPHPVRFALPVRGAWTCTQGVDGPLTHRGPWRHAFDFEVLDSDGDAHPQDAAQLVDHYAFRLPVLATAAGTVVKVVSDIADNEIGSVNLKQNWGNFVIIKHAAGLYSMVAHLAHASVKVVSGQTVQKGEFLGLCGNSGRSAQPHVHFQLQSGPELGDKTVPCCFADAVLLSDEPRIVAALCPQTGDTVRNLDPHPDRAAFFQFPYRAVWSLRVQNSIENIESDLDLYGQLLLRSREHGAVLYYGIGESFFTAYDLIGAPASALHLVRAALSRVPLEETERLRWTDLLPARMFRGRVYGALMDLVAPFLPRDSIEVEYRAERSGGALFVSGVSTRRDRRGRPLFQTRAELLRSVGVTRLCIVAFGRELTIEMATEKTAVKEPVSASELERAA